MNSKAKIEFGDFQTPQKLAEEICALLLERHLSPKVIIEPTCGVGSFLVAASKAFSHAKLFGWDINSDYVSQTQSALNQVGASARSSIETKDFFKHDWEA